MMTPMMMGMVGKLDGLSTLSDMGWKSGVECAVCNEGCWGIGKCEKCEFPWVNDTLEHGLSVFLRFALQCKA